MKTISIFCVAILALALNCSAAAPATAESEFSQNATEWAEGVITQIKPDGHFQINGGKNPYASNFAAFNREYFSIPETERDLRRKELQDRYQSSLIYSNGSEQPFVFSFNVPEYHHMPVFDESGLYGFSLPMWKYPENPVILSYRDLKAGDRVVVGYDTSDEVYSIYRVSPILVASGENNALVMGPISDEVDRNGVHIMNKSSNETNPIEFQRPNRRTGNYSSNENGYGYGYGYGYGFAPVIRQASNPHLSTENNPTSPPNVTNDARNLPANSLSSSAPRPVDTGPIPLQATPGTPPINSSIGTPLNARVQEQQSGTQPANSNPRVMPGRGTMR